MSIDSTPNTKTDISKKHLDSQRSKNIIKQYFFAENQQEIDNQIEQYYQQNKNGLDRIILEYWENYLDRRKQDSKRYRNTKHGKKEIKKYLQKNKEKIQKQKQEYYQKHRDEKIPSKQQRKN